MKENCYFWIDTSVPENERKINVLCEKCHNEKYPRLGWFWEGSKLGYGPYDFICDAPGCGHIISKKEKQ